MGAVNRSGAVSVSRRLAVIARQRKHTAVSNRKAVASMRIARFNGKSRKVGIGTNSKDNLSWNMPELSHWTVAANRRATIKNSSFDIQRYQDKCTTATDSRVTSGSTGSNREISPIRTSTLSAISACSEGGLERWTVCNKTGEAGSIRNQRVNLVVISPKHNGGSGHVGSGSNNGNSDRCINYRLGRSFQWQNLGRSMDSVATQTTHQRSGNESSLPCHAGIALPYAEPKSAGSNRQLNNGFLHQETRGNKVGGHDEADPTRSTESKRAELPVGTCTHSGLSECCSRFGVKSRNDSQHRMETIQEHIQLDPKAKPMGRTNGGFIRKQLESPTANVCVTMPRSESNGSRCNDTSMATDRFVCLSPNDYDGGCSSEDPLGTAPSTSTGGTTSHGSALVPNADEVSSNSIGRIADNSGHAITATLETLASEPKPVQTTSLVHQFQHIVGQGYSSSIVSRLERARAATTNKDYLSKWRLFDAWCCKRSIDPASATSVVIADFLEYLFVRRKVQVRTICGYRAAIACILRRMSGYDFSDCLVMADLIKSFKRDRPMDRKAPVHWDLSIVLNFLRSDAFTGIVPMKLLTLKTTFLVALASGRRCGELHSLSHEVEVINNDWSAVTLRPLPAFVSKTHLRTNGEGAFHQITIPALPGQPDDLTSLCPVAILRSYLARVALFRSTEQERLFISFNENRSADVTAQTIASYVKQLIVLAYKDRIDCNGNAICSDTFHVRAHQVRHVAHSLGAMANIPLNELIRTGSWVSTNTFIDYYLHNFSSNAITGLKSVGSFVAAETVLSPNVNVASASPFRRQGASSFKKTGGVKQANKSAARGKSSNKSHM